MGDIAGLNRSGYRHNAQFPKPIKSFDQPVSPRKAQPGQALTLQRSEPVPSSARICRPPARFDSTDQMGFDSIDGGLDSWKVTPGTAFYNAATGGTSEASHE